jgi:Na+-driven multidrug efflux pump
MVVRTFMAIAETFFFGRLGTKALPGYGIGVRLEFMLVPLAFGIGSGLTTLVGVAAGANDWKRAVRVAWIGGGVAFGLIGTFGWIVALFAEGWSRLFSSGPQVIAATVAYITHVAPFHCLFGLGMALSFASPGAGRMRDRLRHRIVRCDDRGPAADQAWQPKRQLNRGKLAFPTGASDGPPLDDRHLEPQPR